MQFSDILFYMVFLSQVFWISIFIPSRLLARFSLVFTTRPPEEYPKLYPKPIEHYKIAYWAFKWANWLIAGLGLVMLGAIVVLDPREGGGVSQAWPALYGMTQFIPIVMLELLGISQLRDMRRAKSAAVRKATLRPRRFFDLVSPGLFFSAIALYLATLVLDAFLHDFQVRWEVAFWLTFGNLFMAGFGIWAFIGRKPDPHQSNEDRNRQITAGWSGLLAVSILMSLFFMTQAAGNVFDLEPYEATIMSLYFQFITAISIGQTMSSIPIEDVDFSVYREDPIAS